MNEISKPAFMIILVMQILQTCFVVYSTVVYKVVHDTASFIVLPIANLSNNYYIICFVLLVSFLLSIAIIVINMVAIFKRNKGA